MTGDGAPGRAVRWAVLLLALVLVVPACSADEPEDPEAALVQTLEETFAGSFAYRLVAEADREALEALGRDLGSVAARLNLFEVSGVVADETVSVDVQAFGTAPLFQLRRFGDQTVHVRIAAGDGPLRALATPELEGRLLGMAVQTDQPQSVVDAIGALFDGAWVGVTGDFDAGALAGLSTGDRGDAGDDAPAAPTTPLPDVVADYLEVTDRQEDDGTVTLRVDLRVRALLRSLATLGEESPAGPLEEGLALLPETVTGDVVVRDGVAQAIVFDVAEGAREAGQQVPGSLELRLELSDHGQPDVPDQPRPTVVVPSADLTAGLAQLLATPPPGTASSSSRAPTESTSPAAP